MILVMVECTCTTDEEYPSGGKPEFYAAPKLAAARWIDHKQLRSLYWSVHYKGMHVVSVKDDSQLASTPLLWCEYKEIK